ncbi:hypothetical protein Caka_0734 [Coraliomargarita akajimensis DSM 45221]|uniref:Uncharacterized protein n=1 Tax=Coraliomargarita akajimensis (strain DSM 45221 / IAM 15411 / JCM 23193 / KCTC 12865 / 04OKA010-24) TaxID=583355 RepID=D5EPM1_CORAD|nr:hypothetical protein Caka_0734 [Coraliomargarita akajimensis DSM 45221]
MLKANFLFVINAQKKLHASWALGITAHFYRSIVLTELP